jgi:hypothetical protein
MSEINTILTRHLETEIADDAGGGSETEVVEDETEGSETEVVEEETDGSETEVVEEETEDTGEVVQDRTDSRSPTGAFRGGHAGSASTLAQAGLGPVFGKLRSQGYGGIEIEQVGDEIFVSARRAGETRSLVYDATTGALVSDVSAASPQGLLETISTKLPRDPPGPGKSARDAAEARAEGRGASGRGHGTKGGDTGRGGSKGGDSKTWRRLEGRRQGRWSLKGRRLPRRRQRQGKRRGPEQVARAAHPAGGAGRTASPKRDGAVAIAAAGCRG